MITLLAPAALVGLLALPLVVWLHRRLTRATPVVVASLQFLEAEGDAAAAPRRAALDLDLALALAGTAAAVLAAAGPVLRAGPAGRTVRVVVDAGPAMAARAADGTSAASRAEAAVARLAAALGPGDVLARLDVADGDLVAAARRGAGAVRVVVSDRVPPGAEPDVLVVAVGDPAARNLGLVAVAPADGPGPRAVFAAVRNDAEVPRAVRVAADRGGEARLEVPAHGVRSVTVAAPATGPVVIRVDDPDGALAADDAATLVPTAPTVAFAAGGDALPPAHEALVRRTLDAVAPGWREAPEAAAALRVGTGPASRADGLHLRLRAVPPSAPTARGAPGTPREPVPAPFGLDVDATAADLVYPLEVRAAAPWPVLRVGRGVAGGAEVEVPFDPLLGVPAPADTPLWPLLVENVVAAAAGAPAPGGARVLGLLDPERARLGRATRGPDLAAVAAAPADPAPPARPLRGVLLAVAVGCWAVLWGRGARRRVA